MKKTGKTVAALILCLALCLALLPMEGWAADEPTATAGTCGDNLTWTLDDDGTLTISGTGEMYDWGDSLELLLPPWYDDYSKIKRVVVSSGVSSVGKLAFGDFGNCCTLTSISLANTVTKIGSYAFRNCTGLTKLTIRGNGTSIGADAFFGCSSLETVNIQALGNSTTLGARAFGNCRSLKSVVLMSYFTDIGNNAFSGCSSLESITLPSTITSIGESAFASCSALTGITLPASLTSIEYGAFQGCTGLSSIEIPESVTKIGGSVFYNCTSMTRVTIPSSVTDIGGGAFSGCSSLTDISVQTGNPSFSSINGVLFDKEAKILIQYPAGKTQNSYEIPEGVQSIGPYSFRGCKSLTSIGIPTDVTDIGNGAFYDCIALESIDIPSDVSSIGSDAFRGCIALSGIVIPQGITAVNSGTFCDCTALTSVVIPMSVTSVGSDAFCRCTGLACISIPDSVTSIGSSAFSGCSNLETFTIPNGVTSINGGTFSGCSKLTSVEIPDSVTNMGSRAFFGCVSLTGVAFPSNLEYIGSSAFYGCASIRSIHIPEGEIAIYENAFSYCTSLSEVIIENGLSSVPDYAFESCSSLSKVALPSSVTRIGTEAFHDCPGLESIVVPYGVNTIGAYAFSGCTALRTVTFHNCIHEIGQSAFTGTALDTIFFVGSVSEWNAVSIGSFNTQLTSAAIYYNEIDDICRGTCGEDINWELDTSTGALSIFGTGEMPDTTPSWSSLRSYIKSAEISSGITNVGNSAFRNCYDLVSVSIPDSVSIIGGGAFYNCQSLREITIPSGVTGIGGGAFHGCSSLRELTVPSGVTKIEAYTFFDCYSLTSVSLPEGVTEIKYYAFENCRSLKTVTIPSTVTSIYKNEFLGCSSLTVISVAPGNTAYRSIDGVLFDYDKTTLLTYPAGKPDGSCVVPDGVVTIGELAFSGSGYLKSVELADSVTSIEYYAFSGCHALEKVVIPGGVTSFGYSVFSGCEELASAGPTGSSCSIEFGWEDSIPERAFEDCRFLRSVELPDDLTSIGAGAFGSCYSLSDIALPDGLTSIGAGAFSDCISLRMISIPAGVTKLAYNALWCPNLSDVFFEGTEEAWSAISGSAGISCAHLFTSEDYNENLSVEITTEEVPGGVAVTMSAPGGKIYYTLDGTAPCTVSIPYAGTFLLDTAGDWFINAIAIDLSNGTYGDVMTEYVGLEQSGIPTLWEENGAICMSSEAPEGSIYYSYDLTAEPTAASARYDGPILLTETKTVSARVIEQGKAASPIVSYAFYVTGSGMNYPEDSYSFTNTASSFGYSGIYRIKEERYEEIFGSAAGRMLYEIYGGKWGGSCYGMSATSLMFSSGVLDLANYSAEQKTVNGLTAPGSKDSELTKLIERYQVSQFLPAMVTERNDVSSGGNMVISGISGEAEGDALLRAVQSACSGGEPIILIVWRQDLAGSHAVVPYRLETGKIYLYDCNRPNEENILTYAKEDGVYRFSYGEYSYAVSYNTLSTLLEGLEGLQSGQVSLTADGKEQMLVSLNTGSFAIYDTDGNEVRDYAMIRATEDMEQTEETMLYLERGSYTIRNTDGSLESFRVSAATEDDFDTVVAAPGAEIEIGVDYGHLYISVKSEGAEEICFHTRNGIGQENEIELTADYAKIYACTEMATLIETTATSAVGNGEAVELSQRPDETALYEGAIGRFTGDKAREVYDGYAGVRLSTDIGELLPETFTLTAKVTGAGERARVFAASYDADGRMTDIRGWETQAGKTKYPFTIAGGTAEVKLFVLDLTSGEPLTESLTLRQG